MQNANLEQTVNILTTQIFSEVRETMTMKKSNMLDKLEDKVKKISMSLQTYLLLKQKHILLQISVYQSK